MGKSRRSLQIHQFSRVRLSRHIRLLGILEAYNEESRTTPTEKLVYLSLRTL